VPEIDPTRIVIFFIVFLFSLSFHESAHAWTSSRFGDNTGRMLGRITLNPIPHIDPLGTIVLPLLGALGMPFAFGWAKPVPVNPDNWTDRRTANILVSAAGPLSNLLLAAIAFGVAKGLVIAGVFDHIINPMSITPVYMDPALANGLWLFLLLAIMVNVGLAVFNMFPIPPLDGSHVLEEFLPREAAAAYEQIRPYSFFLFMGLMFFGVFGYIILPIQRFVLMLLLV
jgi:Zn-dependent protease